MQLTHLHQKKSCQSRIFDSSSHTPADDVARSIRCPGLKKFRAGPSALCYIALQKAHRTCFKPEAALFASLVDFKPAFDISVRNIILVKLAGCGITQNMLHLIRTILQENLRECIENYSV